MSLGWDLLVPTEFGATLYDQLRGAERPDLGFRPTGVGRTGDDATGEGLPRHGHDIDSTDTPLEAGLGFAVAWDKPGGFVGRDALLEAARVRSARTSRLVNVLLTSPDYDLFGDEPVCWDGKPVGHVRSGGFRPLPRRRVRDRADLPATRGLRRRRPGRRLVPRSTWRAARVPRPGSPLEAVLRPGRGRGSSAGHERRSALGPCPDPNRSMSKPWRSHDP
mgnify:CR=1 FL=1